MVDVIIRCNSKETCERVIQRISLEKGTLTGRLEIENMLFATIPSNKLEEFRSMQGVLELNIDVEVFPMGTIAEYQTIMGIDEFKRNVSRGQGVKVGIVDSGVYIDHPSLQPNFVEGYNIVKKNSDVKDDYNHGTKVAGIICSIGPDYPGIAPESKFYVAKVMSDSNTIRTSDVISGISWCIKKNVDIINISLGSAASCSTFQYIIDSATQSNIIIVAAAGSESSPKSPACTPGAICTGCVREADGSFVNYLSCISDRIDLVAPGFLLLTTSAKGGNVGFFATSATTSVISGVLALLKSAYPTLNRQDLINKLYSYCKDLGTAGRDSTFGRGIPILTAETGLFPITVVSVPSTAKITVK